MNKYIENFVNEYKKDEHSRYRSFDHCRKCFIENRNDKAKRELIALNLYAYLASWGMLRNSFLMQKDYLFNLPVVDILCDRKYDCLLEFNPFNDEAYNMVPKIMELRNEIVNYYLGKKYITSLGTEEVITRVTDTLVSKIILGTFGCVCAYDQYLAKVLRKKKIPATFNEKSLNKLIDYSRKYKDEIIKVQQDLGDLYTEMKVLDMMFWKDGVSNEKSK